MLTNNAPLLREAFPIHFPELVQVFDPILFSFQFDHVKPEREIFQLVQEHLEVPADEIFFIDDQASHVASAVSVGWDAVQYESPEGLRRALAQRQIKLRIKREPCSMAPRTATVGT